LKGDKPVAEVATTITTTATTTTVAAADDNDKKEGEAERRRRSSADGQKSSGLKPTSILSFLNEKKYNNSIH
jgi:hypothetical protein